MQMLSPGASLKQWHDFYSLIGGASATLVALMFVAASVGAGVFKLDQHEVGIRSFLSPTVVHFSAIVVICLIGTVPIETWTSLGVLEAGAGAIGLVYSTFI